MGNKNLKKCSDCNAIMVECNNPMVRSNLDVSGSDVSNLDLRYYNYNTGNLLTPWAYVKARACPVCGKLELYVDPIKAKLNEVIYD